jgi:adenylate cyclase
VANGADQQAAHLLRQALQSLDAATVEPLRQEIEGMLRTRFQESWFLHSASRFIGQQYMDFLLDHAGQSKFRGERQDVVILFCDLGGFTTLTEQFAAEPEKFVTILNDYLRHMTRCIEYFGGIVSQFTGDGVMAVFSLPAPRPVDDAKRAVLAALMIQEELQCISCTLPADIPRLAMGVGLQ